VRHDCDVLIGLKGTITDWFLQSLTLMIACAANKSTALLSGFDTDPEHTRWDAVPPKEDFCDSQALLCPPTLRCQELRVNGNSYILLARNLKEISDDISSHSLPTRLVSVAALLRRYSPSPHPLLRLLSHVPALASSNQS